MKAYKFETLNFHNFVISYPIFIKFLSNFIFFQVLFKYGLQNFESAK